MSPQPPKSGPVAPEISDRRGCRPFGRLDTSEIPWYWPQPPLFRIVVEQPAPVIPVHFHACPHHRASQSQPSSLCASRCGYQVGFDGSSQSRLKARQWWLPSAQGASFAVSIPDRVWVRRRVSVIRDLHPYARPTNGLCEMHLTTRFPSADRVFPPTALIPAVFSALAPVQ
jgi:hypothetical protein